MVGTKQLNCHVTAGDYELFHDDSSHAGVRWTWQSSFSNNKTAGVKVWRCCHLQGCHTQVASGLFPALYISSLFLASFPGPRPAFCRFPYCKRQKAGRGLGTRLAYSQAPPIQLSITYGLNKAKRLWYFFTSWLPIRLNQRLQPLLYRNDFTNFI